MEKGRDLLPGLKKAQVAGVLLAIVGIVLFVLALGNNDPNVWQSYLVGFIIWTGLTLGCLALTLLKHVTRGSWGFPIIRFLETGAMMVPLMAILFIPILMNLGAIYPWARPELVAQSDVLQHKAALLNPTGFGLRAVVYFVLWTFMAYVLAMSSKKEDETGDPELVIRRNSFAAPMAVLFVLAVTFAITDWVMSLEYHWFSTIFGLLTVVGQALFAMAVATVFAVSVSKLRPFSDFLTRQSYKDFGNLLLTMTILWAYMSFAQFLIIWSGNLPEEITYYLDRGEGDWRWFGGALIFLHFFLPFFLLLSSRVKRTPTMLGWVAAFIVCIRIVDLIWVVVPSLHRVGSPFHWTDLAAFLGIGGLWIIAFSTVLATRYVLPQYDFPKQELLEHA